MECLFGLTGKGFAVIASDGNAARSIVKMKSEEDKQRVLSQSLVMAVSGESGDTTQFGEYVERNMRLYSIRHNVDLRPKAAAAWVRSQLAQSIRSRKPYQVNLLLGGYDAPAHEPALYWIDYLGTMAQVPFAAHGYASYLTLSTMDRYHRPDMSLDEALELLQRCINEMRTRFVIDVGRFHVRVIDRDGVREFREMAGSRIETLLASFPKLIHAGSQHTFVETDSVRFVYQPLEDLYMILITTKNSNILQDIDSLHLFARAVSDQCHSLDESDILMSCFEILDAFDEIAAMGYRENVSLSQIRTMLEMDSHEERIHEIIERNKELEAKEELKRRARQLEMQRRDAARRHGDASSMPRSFDAPPTSSAPVHSMPSETPAAAAAPTPFKGKGMSLSKKPKGTSLLGPVAKASKAPAAVPPSPVVPPAPRAQAAASPSPAAAATPAPAPAPRAKPAPSVAPAAAGVAGATAASLLDDMTPTPSAPSTLLEDVAAPHETPATDDALAAAAPDAWAETEAPAAADAWAESETPAAADAWAEAEAPAPTVDETATGAEREAEAPAYAAADDHYTAQDDDAWPAAQDAPSEDLLGDARTASAVDAVADEVDAWGLSSAPADDGAADTYAEEAYAPNESHYDEVAVTEHGASEAAPAAERDEFALPSDAAPQLRDEHDALAEYKAQAAYEHSDPAYAYEDETAAQEQEYVDHAYGADAPAADADALAYKEYMAHDAAAEYDAQAAYEAEADHPTDETHAAQDAYGAQDLLDAPADAAAEPAALAEAPEPAAEATEAAAPSAAAPVRSALPADEPAPPAPVPASASLLPEVPAPTPWPTQAESPAAASGPAPAPAPAGVHLVLKERVSMSAHRDGGVSSLEVKGDLLLKITDKAATRLRVQLDTDDHFGGADVQFRTHPHVDKQPWASEHLISLRDPKRAFPVDQQVGVLRWRAVTKDESVAPLSVTVWASAADGGACDINVEYQLDNPALELDDVAIVIPLPAGVSPDAATPDDGTCDVDTTTQRVTWRLPRISQANPSSSMELTVSHGVDSADQFFPVSVDFTAHQPLLPLQVVSVADATSGAPLPFTSEASLVAEHVLVH